LRGAGCALAIASLPLFIPFAAANGLGRDDEAVVLTGSADPSLAGMLPDRLVAFRWSPGWARIPVQVDERAVVDFATIYGDPEPSGFTVRTYTDPGTFTGPDPDPLLDADDEIVLRVRDSGLRATERAGQPPGVVPASGLELALANPVTGETAWIYLFRSDGSLPPLPPSPDVVYDFSLLSGDYRETYDTTGASRGNPETSVVSTPSYRVGFSDRWLRVDTGILRDGAPGVDLLERHRNRFAPDNCTRTEWTFSTGEGAFIVNKNGPVRALRGYVGANSGVTTFRIHAFYESTETIRTVLRVHEIPGIMDFFDWDVTTAGMTWRNDRNPSGVPVDASSDPVEEGAYLWESLSGPQGSLAMVPVIETDIPGFSWTSWYSDTIPAQASPCSGQGDDDAAYGSSGIWRNSAVPNTDPAVIGDVYTFVMTRTIRYLGPNAPGTAGPALHEEVSRPVTVALAAYGPSNVCADADGDGWAPCEESCEPPEGTSCGDCDDTLPSRHPGAAETCNGIDDDCDASIDEDLPRAAWYRDADGDGWGDAADSVVTCDAAPPEGRVGRAGDCDDTDPVRNPSASEVCDGIDQNCDGTADEGVPYETFYRDADGDGFGTEADTEASCDGTPPSGYVRALGDCDDTLPSRHPGAAETCNGIDDDCDASIDEDLPFRTWYRDADADGFGSPSATTDSCETVAPSGFAANEGDCDDADAQIHPEAAETCNARDDDCDLRVDEDLEGCGGEDCADRDGDGWYGCGDGCAAPPGAACGDCDDGDPLRNPAASEVCDGRDDDCDGATDGDLPTTTWYADSDGDGSGRGSSTLETCDPSAPPGFSAESGDCDDANPGVHPRAFESCDGVDNDCSPANADGSSETWLGEVCDGDDADACPTGNAVCRGGARACDDDLRSSVDLCDGFDNDCDGVSNNPACERFDLDGSGRVDGFELAWIGRAFGSCRTPEESPWWTPVDFNGDLCVDGEDLSVLANLWARACNGGRLDCL
jgi:hypothetical protein